MNNEDEGLPKDTDIWTIDYKDLEFESEIGSGQFGSIMKGYYLGTPVAIKKLYSQSFSQDVDFQKYLQREIIMLKTLAHPNIVQFLGLCNRENQIYLINELLTNGDLAKILHKNRNKNILPWELRVKFMIDAAKGVAFIHKRGFLHRDLKCENLLLDSNWNCKICDLGFARKVRTKQEKFQRQLTICGTDEFMAPEVILGDYYNEKADVYSMGMIFYECIMREKPPKRRPNNYFDFDVEEFKQNLPKETPEDFFQLVIDCAKLEANDRPTMLEVLNRLTEIDKKLTEKNPNIKINTTAKIFSPTTSPQLQKITSIDFNSTEESSSDDEDEDLNVSRLGEKSGSFQISTGTRVEDLANDDGVMMTPPMPRESKESSPVSSDKKNAQKKKKKSNDYVATIKFEANKSINFNDEKGILDDDDSPSKKTTVVSDVGVESERDIIGSSGEMSSNNQLVNLFLPQNGESNSPSSLSPKKKVSPRVLLTLENGNRSPKGRNTAHKSHEVSPRQNLTNSSNNNYRKSHDVSPTNKNKNLVISPRYKDKDNNVTEGNSGERETNRFSPRINQILNSQKISPRNGESGDEDLNKREYYLKYYSNFKPFNLPNNSFFRKFNTTIEELIDKTQVVKMGEIEIKRRKWKKRFCVLTSFTLYIFTKNKKHKINKGSLLLYPNTKVTPSTKKSNSFEMTCHSYNVEFKCKNEEDLKSWVSSINQEHLKFKLAYPNFDINRPHGNTLATLPSDNNSVFLCSKKVYEKERFDDLLSQAPVVLCISNLYLSIVSPFGEQILKSFPIDSILKYSTESGNHFIITVANPENKNQPTVHSYVSDQADLMYQALRDRKNSKI